MSRVDVSGAYHSVCLVLMFHSVCIVLTFHSLCIFILISVCLVFQAGIIEEMMDDAFESLDDQDELEEDAQNEVDKILFEITAGQSLYVMLCHGR